MKGWRRSHHVRRAALTSALRDVKTRIQPLFTQQRVAVSAERFLDGLLGEEPRKTGWMRAEAAVIQDRGASRRFSGGDAGMPMICATCANVYRERQALT
jgi:hypothetical protein